MTVCSVQVSLWARHDTVDADSEAEAEADARHAWLGAQFSPANGHGDAVAWSVFLAQARYLRVFVHGPPYNTFMFAEAAVHFQSQSQSDDPADGVTVWIPMTPLMHNVPVCRCVCALTFADGAHMESQTGTFVDDVDLRAHHTANGLLRTHDPVRVTLSQPNETADPTTSLTAAAHTLDTAIGGLMETQWRLCDIFAGLNDDVSCAKTQLNDLCANTGVRPPQLDDIVGVDNVPSIPGTPATTTVAVRLRDVTPEGSPAFVYRVELAARHAALLDWYVRNCVRDIQVNRVGRPGELEVLLRVAINQETVTWDNDNDDNEMARAFVDVRSLRPVPTTDDDDDTYIAVYDLFSVAPTRSPRPARTHVICRRLVTDALAPQTTTTPETLRAVQAVNDQLRRDCEQLRQAYGALRDAVRQVCERLSVGAPPGLLEDEEDMSTGGDVRALTAEAVDVLAQHTHPNQAQARPTPPPRVYQRRITDRHEWTTWSSFRMMWRVSRNNDSNCPNVARVSFTCARVGYNVEFYDVAKYIHRIHLSNDRGDRATYTPVFTDMIVSKMRSTGLSPTWVFFDEPRTSPGTAYTIVMEMADGQTVSLTLPFASPPAHPDNPHIQHASQLVDLKEATGTADPDQQRAATNAERTRMIAEENEAQRACFTDSHELLRTLIQPPSEIHDLLATDVRRWAAAHRGLLTLQSHALTRQLQLQSQHSQQRTTADADALPEPPNTGADQRTHVHA